ncbi:MAG: GNAT family N-acetyltransferase [Pseudomonadota bacterium]
MKPHQIAVGVKPRDQAIEVLTLAFALDPVARWFYPNEEYWRHFPIFVQAFAGRSFDHWTACHASGSRGAALWLPPHVHPDEHAVVKVIESTVARSRRGEVFDLMGELGEHHPHTPHWYLPVIGVHPDHYSRGIGTELLLQGLERADTDALPAYLEATTDKSRELYERLGFRATGTIKAGSSPPLYPMVRAPDPRAEP